MQEGRVHRGAPRRGVAPRDLNGSFSLADLLGDLASLPTTDALRPQPRLERTDDRFGVPHGCGDGNRGQRPGHRSGKPRQSSGCRQPFRTGWPWFPSRRTASRRRRLSIPPVPCRSGDGTARPTPAGSSPFRRSRNGSGRGGLFANVEPEERGTRTSAPADVHSHPNRRRHPPICCGPR